MSNLNRELIDCNSEALRRLMGIVAKHLPSTSGNISDLFEAWTKDRSEILKEKGDE